MRALLLFFQSRFLYLFFFSDFCAWTSRSMLNNSGESGHPCLVPDLRGNAFSFSPLRMMFAVGLSYMAFTMLRQVPPMPIFWKVLMINQCWILSKASSASIEIIIWFLSFSLLIWYITLLDLYILKNSCILGMNLTWSWCRSFWHVAEFCLLKFCWGFLHLYSSVILPVVFFFCVLFFWFLYQSDGSLTKWVWKYSFLYNFLKEF